LLRDADDPATITAANLAEVIDVLVRGHGNPLADVRERLDWLLASGLEVRAVDRSLGLLAGELRARFYHRQRRPLSLADCIALAAAFAASDALATSDPPLATAARELGVRVHALPDSRGLRP
jgi:predicted nucleic acid-binding protein